MEKNKKNTGNTGFVVLAVTLIVILSVLCVLFATGTLEFNSKSANNDETTQTEISNNESNQEADVDNNQSNKDNTVVDNNQSNQDSAVVEKTYKLGDDVVLTQLSSIPYEKLGNPDYIADFSEWKVLKDEGEYITLYYCGDDSLYGKATKEDTLEAYNTKKILFTSNGIDFGETGGELRLLNKSDLEILGCDFDTLTFSDLPDWINSGWTSYVKGHTSYTISDNKLEPTREDSLCHSTPVIKILKSNIK